MDFLLIIGILGTIFSFFIRTNINQKEMDFDTINAMLKLSKLFFIIGSLLTIICGIRSMIIHNVI